MSALTDYENAVKELNAAKEYYSIIGRVSQKATATNTGKWHGLSVSTEIHYQPYDGAKNYHKCKEFDNALSEIIEFRIEELAEQAIQSLTERAARKAKEARDSLYGQLLKMDDIIAAGYIAGQSS